MGREEVGIELDKIAEYYKDKVVFITGAGGSIGSEIVRNILKLPVRKCISFGHGENSIHNLIEEFRFDNRFGFVIGDIRDIDKLNYELSIYKPDIVFHAAAHKHLPLMEDYPDESVKNNIFGTHNVLTASIKNGVKRFLLISTDKAVNPTSVMGATKRIAELVVLSYNNFQSVTRTSIVRFGNVLGSRGSVIPTFKKHIESGGPINLTDPNIERFFMSIPEAAKLVIKSICITSQNDKSNIFILDMGRPIKIMDLAKNLIKLSGHNEDEIQIRVVGLRKGEKLFEELSYDKEKLFTTQFDKILSTSEANIELTQEQLTLMLDEFTNAAKVFNTNEIKRLLKKYIPQYKF